MATALQAKDFRIIENPMGAGFVLTVRGKLFGTHWFETWSEGRDFVLARFA